MMRYHFDHATKQNWNLVSESPGSDFRLIALGYALVTTTIRRYNST